jgi:DNA/RNA-binding domain of Phe-tRNA-synthetase-like protein
MASIEYALPFAWDDIDVCPSDLELALGSSKADWNACTNVSATTMNIVRWRARSDNGAGSQHIIIPGKPTGIHRIDLRG